MARGEGGKVGIFKRWNKNPNRGGVEASNAATSQDSTVLRLPNGMDDHDERRAPEAVRSFNGHGGPIVISQDGDKKPALGTCTKEQSSTTIATCESNDLGEEAETFHTRNGAQADTILASQKRMGFSLEQALTKRESERSLSQRSLSQKSIAQSKIITAEVEAVLSSHKQQLIKAGAEAELKIPSSIPSAPPRDDVKLEVRSQQQQPQQQQQPHHPQQPLPKDPNAPLLIQVQPGLKVALRRATEVKSALMVDFYATAACSCCSRNLVVIANAAFVFCPVCSEMSPLLGTIQPVSTSFPVEPEYLRHGLGLGLTWDTMKKVHQEMYVLS